MADPLAGLKGQAARFKENPKQAALIAGIVVAALVCAVVFFKSATKPAYDVLYSGLSTKDSAAVVEVVEASGAKYELKSQGDTSTIMVQSDRVDRLRMDLAAENLPADSVAGYELLDNQGVTVSTFREQVNYQRGLQGEIARTLMTLDSVSKASVHIVLPEEKLYKDEQKPATASVTLTTRSELGKKQVEAITHLVSAAVPGLEPSNVSITDANGTQLTNSADAGFGDEAEAETAYAARMESAATSMLSKVVGPDSAAVRVQADLDFTKRTRQSENFDGEDTAVRKQVTEDETMTNRDKTAEGVLTTAPEDPVNAPNQNTPNSEYARKTGDTDYEISKQVTSETDAPGAVRKLSVSVLIDPDKTDMDIQAAEDIVSRAVGLDAARGDQIVVQMQKFAQPEEADDSDLKAAEKAAADAAAAKKLRDYGFLGAAVLGILILAVFLFLSRRKGDPDATEYDENGDPLIPMDDSTLSSNHLDSNNPLGVPSNEVGEADRLRKHVLAQPEAAANAISGMIAADKVGRQ